MATQNRMPSSTGEKPIIHPSMGEQPIIQPSKGSPSSNLSGVVLIVFIVLCIATGVAGIITTPMLISKDISKRYKLSLILALVGFVCAILPFILLLIINYASKKDVPHSHARVVMLICFFVAAVCFHASFLIRKEPSDVDSHEKLSMTIQIFVYAGLIFNFSFAILLIIMLIRKLK